MKFVVSIFTRRREISLGGSASPQVCGQGHHYGRASEPGLPVHLCVGHKQGHETGSPFISCLGGRAAIFVMPQRQGHHFNLASEAGTPKQLCLADLWTCRALEADFPAPFYINLRWITLSKIITKNQSNLTPYHPSVRSLTP